MRRSSGGEANLAHFLTRLASFVRLIVFDKRGTGLSDPIVGTPTMAERMDDIRAVMDAVGSERAALLGVSEGGTLAMSFAHTHPERAQALALYGSWAHLGLAIRPRPKPLPNEGWDFAVEEPCNARPDRKRRHRSVSRPLGPNHWDLKGTNFAQPSPLY